MADGTSPRNRVNVTPPGVVTTNPYSVSRDRAFHTEDVAVEAERPQRIVNGEREMIEGGHTAMMPRLEVGQLQL